jgi:hypothetical protein
MEGRLSIQTREQDNASTSGPPYCPIADRPNNNYNLNGSFSLEVNISNLHCSSDRETTQQQLPE